MGADRWTNGSDRGHSEGDRVSPAPCRDVSALQVHSTEGLPALWPSRLWKDFDRTSGSSQPLKAGGGVGPGCLRYEGGQDSGDSGGLSPHQGAGDPEYVVGGVGTDGPGFLRPGPREPEGGGLALYLYR